MAGASFSRPLVDSSLVLADAILEHVGSQRTLVDKRRDASLVSRS